MQADPPVTPQETLVPHQIHLWCAFLPMACHGLDRQHLDLLNGPELQQHARFVFEKDRHRYLVTRALVRTVLSRYAPIAPKDWLFKPNAYGRPEIANANPAARQLRFNVSHTDGLVVVAVTTGRDIGIDTESMARTAPLGVAKSFFSPREAHMLWALPSAEQPRRFWELWTFKESYIKARGMGLSLPLNRFSFELEDASTATATFDPSLGDDPSRWSFWQILLDTHHLLAICLERRPGEPTEFVCRQIRPLIDEMPLRVSAVRGSIMLGLAAE
jgi:4'-phosphopantetheinyl transferase